MLGGGGEGQDTDVIYGIHTRNINNDRGIFGGICNTILDLIVCNRGGVVGALCLPSFPSYY